MQAYRDRYAEIQKMNGRVIAVSIDDVETLKRWREELKAPQTFVADPDKKLIALYDTKMPILPVAQRRTFVIGKGRKVLELQEGNEAIDPAKSVRACTLPQKGAPPHEPAPVSKP